MDKCVYCGALTFLYLDDDPVCMECVDNLKSSREPGENRKPLVGRTSPESSSA